MRRSFLIWTVLCLAAVIGLFVVKHRVQALEEKLNRLNAEIIADRHAVQVLQAEWSYLNQPARLEALGRKLLDMQAPQPGQTVLMEEFLQQLPGEPGPPGHPGGNEPGTQVAVQPKPPASRNTDEEDWLTPILATLKKSR